MNIAILAGEISGELIGAALARELRSSVTDIQLWGLGADKMREAGVELLADCTGWSAISITQAVQRYLPLRLKVLPRVIRALHQRMPDVVVLIDFGAFNRRVAREAKKRGLKVCWYFPPGAAWRRTGTKGANLAAITDVLVVPFEWSAERLRSLGANAINVGHPIIERTATAMSRVEFCNKYGMDPSKPIIGLLPGSRLHEIEHLMPALLGAARIIYSNVRDAQFIIGVAPGLSRENIGKYLSNDRSLSHRVADAWHEFGREAESKIIRPVTRSVGVMAGQAQRQLVTVEGVVVAEETLHERDKANQRSNKIRSDAERVLPPIVLAKGVTSDIMANSDVLLTCSGTATLEAAAFETPMVILYRLSWLMELEARLLGLKKKIKMIGLPNILAEKMIVPELIQHDATPEAIATNALRLLNDVESRHEVKQELHKVREMMGEPGASARAARVVLELAAARRRASGHTGAAWCAYHSRRQEHGH